MRQKKCVKIASEKVEIGHEKKITPCINNPSLFCKKEQKSKISGFFYKALPKNDASLRAQTVLLEIVNGCHDRQKQVFCVTRIIQVFLNVFAALESTYK